MADTKQTIEDNSSGELIPPKGHKDVGPKVFQILSQILDDKIDIGIHSRSLRNYELSRNKHWRTKNAPVPLVSANLIYVHIQRTSNTLTDNNPTFNVARVGGEDEDQYPQDLFNDIQHAADHWWIDQEQQDVLDTSIHNGEIYGFCVEKVIFNPEAEYNLGEVETVCVDPFHFGFFPLKLRDPRDIQKCEAVLHFYPMSVREAKRRWPDKADDIKPDEDVFKDLGDERRELTSQEQAKGQSLMVSIASTIKELLNFFSGSSKLTDEVLIVECWCKDYTLKKSKKKKKVEKPAPEAEDGGNVFDEVEVQTSEPKYPGNIRVITACNSGKVVLEDKGNPNVNPNLPVEEAQKTYLYDKFPFIMANSVKDTSSAWGVSDIEELEYLNIELDKAISQMIYYKDKAARLKIINPRSSGVQNEEFTNAAGFINPSNSNEAAAIRYLDVPQMPVDIQQAISLFKELFFLVAGTFELDQAQAPGKNVIAYKAIAALLERAATMMRGKIRSYSRLIRERGRMYLSHVQNFYTEDRWITFTDRAGVEITKKINGTKLRIPAKLTVVSGSTMPISKVQQREEALALFQQRAIDQEDLLDKLEWSGRNDIIARMKQGPVGQAMAKLAQIGVPQPLLQVFGQVIMAEPDKIQKAMQDGQLPQFAQIMQQMQAQAQGKPPAQPPVDPAVQAEAQLKQAQAKKVLAEIQKVDADRSLVIEKINTEKVDQMVKQAGVQFDQEQMKVNRAKTVAEIEKQSEEAGIQRVEMARSIEAQRHSENMDKVGMGKDIAAQRHGQEMDKANFVSSQENRPGFNESGMKSDNKEE